MQERAYRGMRIGLLGGSFNPAHDGHRHISLIAMKRLGLDRVWWLVSPQNPLKSAIELAPLEQRMARARQVAQHPHIVVSDFESRVGTQFTCDTLAVMRQRWPGVRFVWLMGADNLIQMPRWRRWRWIMNTVAVLVLDRPGAGIKSLHGQTAISYRRAWLPGEKLAQLTAKKPPAWGFIACRRHAASSTSMRAKIKSQVIP